MHSIRVTLATYGHTPYTCVYTPIYPHEFTWPIRKPDVLTQLDTRPRITGRSTTEITPTHIAKRQAIYADSRHPTDLHILVSIC